MRKRLRPGMEISIPFGKSAIVGPVGHPVVCEVHYVRGGLYDTDAFAVLQALLDPGDIFLDAGANIGCYSVLASDIVGSGGLVIAFEPAESELKYLRMNLARSPARHIVEPVALSNRQGFGAVTGTHATTRFLDVNAEGSEIAVKTLDQVVGSLDEPWSRSLLKVDVEGFEPAVIKGASGWLAHGPIGLIIEANGLQDKRSPVKWDTAVELLQAASYEFVWPHLADRTMHRFAAPPSFSPFENYLAVRSDLLPRLQSGLLTVKEWC